MQDSALAQIFIAYFVFLDVLYDLEILFEKDLVSVQLFGGHVFEKRCQSMQRQPAKNRVNDFAENAPGSLRNVQSSIVCADVFEYLQVNLINARLMSFGPP